MRDETTSQLNGEQSRLLVELSDLRAMDNMLEGYIAHLSKTKLPASHQRICILAGLRLRLAEALVCSEEQEEVVVWLTVDEARAMQEAIGSFGVLLHCILLPSQERDKLLAYTLALCQQIATTFSSATG